MHYVAATAHCALCTAMLGYPRALPAAPPLGGKRFLHRHWAERELGTAVRRKEVHQDGVHLHAQEIPFLRCWQHLGNGTRIRIQVPFRRCWGPGRAK